jgi:hypothetical protein
VVALPALASAPGASTHVTHAVHAWISEVKNGIAEVIIFHLCYTLPAGSLHCKINAANPGEQ